MSEREARALRRPGRPALGGRRYTTRLGDLSADAVDALAGELQVSTSAAIARLVDEALATRRRRARSR